MTSASPAPLTEAEKSAAEALAGIASRDYCGQSFVVESFAEDARAVVAAVERFKIGHSRPSTEPDENDGRAMKWLKDTARKALDRKEQRAAELDAAAEVISPAPDLTYRSEEWLRDE